MTTRTKSDGAIDNKKTPTYFERAEILRRTALDYSRKAPELDAHKRDEKVIAIVKEAKELYAMYFYFSAKDVLQPQSELIVDPESDNPRRCVFWLGRQKRGQDRNGNGRSDAKGQLVHRGVDFIREAADALTRELKLSRWSSQCLAHFALYTDLLHKLEGFHRDSGVRFPRHPEATRFLSFGSVNQADVRSMAEACKLLAELNGLSSSDPKGFRVVAYDWVVEKSIELNKTERLSLELAIISACLSNWIYLLENDGDQKLDYDWMPSSWLPVGGDSGDQQQIMLIYLTVNEDDGANKGYVAARDRKYVLSISSEMSNYKLIVNELGRIVVLHGGKVEIEWQLNVPNSILMGKAERRLYVTVVCSGLESPPIYGDFGLRVCEREKVSPNVSRCKDKDFGLISLDSNTNSGTETQEQALLNGLRNAVRQAFGVQTDTELNEFGVLIDARCGRFLKEAIANQIDLAKELIRQIVEIMIQDGWWYVSRPQIEKAIERLVSPDRNLGMDPIVDKYIDQCLANSTVIGTNSLPYEHVKFVLLEIGDLPSKNKEATIRTIVDSSLRSTHDRLRQDSVNIPGVLDELVRVGLLTESKGQYKFANGFVRSWVQRQCS